MSGELDLPITQITRSGSSSGRVPQTRATRAPPVNVGSPKYCIFRVPQSLFENNQNAYRPNKVTIGPYHSRNEQFEEMQRHKQRFAEALFVRGRQTQNIASLAETLNEERIKECYSRIPADVIGDELTEMMVIDGCFIIELFLKYRDLAGRTGQGHDPLLTGPLALPFLMGDLVKLENQIPWFVLEHLYNQTVQTWNQGHPSLSNLALNFFKCVPQGPVDGSSEKLHLLNVLRLTLVHGNPEPNENDEQDKFLRLIQPASELNQVGIKFKPTQCENFIDIKFENGVLKIPVLKFDDFLGHLLLNFIAFEQCHGKSSHVTTYAIFMGCLLNTPADARFLCNCNIIERYYGTDERIAHFFSNIGKNVVFNIRRNYLRSVFHDVNKYRETDWRVHWASFKNTYFETRWYMITTIVAFTILALTAIQSFYAVYAYYRPPH